MSEVRNIYIYIYIYIGLMPFRRELVKRFWGFARSADGAASPQGGWFGYRPPSPRWGRPWVPRLFIFSVSGSPPIYIKAWASAALPALSHAAVCYGLQVCCDLGSLFVSGPPRTVLPVQFRVPSSDRWSWGVAEA